MDEITPAELEFWKQAALITLQGKLSTEGENTGYHTHLDDLARECFDHADAMLEELRGRMEILQHVGRIMRGEDAG